MSQLPAPKLLKWVPSIDQQYLCDKSILLVSGCSFTAWTNQLDMCATWPGFVLDRCGFDHCIDWSFSGAGNVYIGDSILYQLSLLSDEEVSKYLVIIMWSGLNRISNKIENSNEMPNINGINYDRTNSSFDTEYDVERKKQGAQESADKILEVKQYLESRNISFVFSFYCNLLFSPYLPKRDTTHVFDGYIDNTLLKELKEIEWIPKDPMDHMFEYGFKNDLLDEDLFHPSIRCSELWTDKVLLTEMCRRGMIQKI